MGRHYLILAGKVLLRRKFFTFISLFGIVATLVLFVVVAAFFDAAFGPGVPELQQDRMLGVSRVTMFGAHNAMSAAGGFMLFDRYARNLPGAERLTIYSEIDGTYSFSDGQKIPVGLKRTDADFWNVFDFSFVEGRPYSAADVDRGSLVGVLSVSTRDRLLGPGPAVGRVVEVDGQRFTVAGVVDDVSRVRTRPTADMWVPITSAKTTAYREGLIGRFNAVVLGRDRAALPGIKAEFNSRLSRIELPREFTTLMSPLETPFEGLARELSPNRRNPDSQGPWLIAVLTGVALLVALLPAVNLINLNVSRIMERASEIGVRKAFGASSRTLVLQFVVENVLLTLVGALAAFVCAWFVLRGINGSGMIAHAQFALSYRVFLVGVALAVGFGVLSGAYPAWRMSRLHAVDALKGQTR